MVISDDGGELAAKIRPVFDLEGQPTEVATGFGAQNPGAIGADDIGFAS